MRVDKKVQIWENYRRVERGSSRLAVARLFDRNIHSGFCYVYKGEGEGGLFNRCSVEWFNALLFAYAFKVNCISITNGISFVYLSQPFNPDGVD